ncbi:nitroreductase family protein [Methylotenera sp.]|uniref:nitroreductase family protein n=1 Tax=Methylotenera sp. TaxID=2051956 RepID=UPI002488FDFD|nr:nitroreductase family protein [Methylotenera sp.]MDI1361522.1 nitroreductase family protein [Methylotenera sp.]
MTQITQQNWPAFQALNRHRRAIRKFNTASIADEDIQELLVEAMLAPSSGNLQPYQLHWIRNTDLKAEVAKACHGQQAASTAAEIVVISASAAIAKHTVAEQLAYVEASTSLESKSKAYYRKQLGMFNKVLGIGASAIWMPLIYIASLIRPSLSLLPVGSIGSRNWAARNAMFAAQTIMLAAASKGIDSCPMEGFSASKITKLLNLPRGTVIPIVIALGYRASDARVETQWRRKLSDALITH